MPTTDESLPQMEQRPKGEWVGLVPRVVGFFVGLGVLLRVRAAIAFMDDFHTSLIGSPYLWHHTGGPADASLQIHERIHKWQELLLGRWRYVRMWLSREGRRDLEAMACAAEVLGEWRTLENRAKSLASPIYRLGWSQGAAAVRIAEWVHKWRDAGWDKERLEEELPDEVS